MAYTPNAKDMKTLSDAILDNKMQVTDLPAGAQYALQSYWAQSGVDFSDPEMSQKQMSELIQQRRDQTASGGIFDSPLFKPIEWVGSKLYWAYSKTVSPILSAGTMALHSVVYGRPDYIGEDGEWDALKDYWSLAHKVSPGQSIWMLGLNDKELAQRGIRPDQIAQDSSLQAEGKYHDEKTKNDLFGVKTRAQEYFGSGASKYVTGATDFAVSWYLDPLVLSGKAAGAAKRVGFTKNIEAATKSGTKMDEFVAKPAFTKMVDTVMAAKKANPDNAALVLRRDLPTIARSANGDALARLLSQAKDSGEVTDILRLSIGDNAARLPLELENAKLAPQIEMMTQSRTILANHYDALSDITKATPRGQAIKASLDRQTQYINNLNQQSRIIDDKLDAFASVDNMNFNRVTTPLGMKVKGSASFQDAQFKNVRGQGIIKAAGALVYNSTLGWPIKVIRSYNDIRPTHFLDVHAEDSYKALNASLQEVKGLSREGREMYVSRYIETAPNERGLALVKMENQIAHRMVDRFNLKHAPGDQISYELADDLYKDFAQRRSNAQAAASKQRSYSSATMPDPKDPTRTIRVAEIEADGGRLVSTPLFDTQLANSHVLMDFGQFERALEAHGSAFQKLKNKFGDGWYKTSQVADTLSTTWKFAQLFRLGYAPRALADDFLGQVARFGPLAMVERAAKGGKISLEDFVRGKWSSDSVAAARQTQGMLAQHIEELAAQQAATKSQLLREQAAGGPNVQQLTDDLTDITDEITRAKSTHADYGQLVAYGQQMRDVKIGREVFTAPFGGKQGELFRDLASGQRNFNNLMGSQADWYLKKMRRSDWENITPATHGPEKHMDAWIRHINDQIGQSEIGKRAIAGLSESELVHWMRSMPEGRKYRADIGLKNISDYELAQRVKGAVDYVLDPALPGMDAIRAAILQGKLEKEMLEAIPKANRPMINAQSFKYAEGTHPVAQLLDKSITGYYNLANQMPASKLLRNPLFGQSYKAHLASELNILKGQGVTHIDEALRKRMEARARRGALDDVKKFTFTMDHETKMAYSMRHFGAFFGAQQESWNRWARIISDKPDVLARVGQVYGAPARAGMVVDQNGNTVDAAGYSTDPTTGKKTLVDYSDRKMLIQVPEYLGGRELNKTLGLDEDAKFVVPMSSVELVLNHGDGALPVGTGPYVQIAANHFAKEDPGFADWAQKMGVLPFGAQDSWTDFINPTTGKRLGDSNDDMGATKQRALFYMMQVENYKYEQGLRKTQPTWGELKERADRWTIFRTAAAFALPFSVNGQDPYQFFRDEFQRYQKLDANTADEKFYDKYGDSFYMFSQSMSKNNTGLRPTSESVKMSKYYKDLIDKVGPQYAGLIVGAEGDGEYSNGAFYYQKTHEAAPGAGKTERSNLSARDAWTEGQVARGWRQYNSLMEDANSKLFDRGLQTFDDPGAEDLKDYKKGVQLMLTTQYLPDGTENPYYNESWEAEFNSLDKGKYDRTAFDLEKVVNDPELMSKAINEDGTVGIRSDIYTLKGYLTYRREMQKALLLRKINGGSDDITAQQNYDLKNSWDQTVMALIEADTKFGWLHSRYFATDMGFNMDVHYTPEEQSAMAKDDASLIGEQATNFQGQDNMFDTMSKKAGGFGGNTITNG